MSRNSIIKKSKKSIEDDSIEALSKLGKGKFNGKSISQLKEEARREIEEDD